MVILLKLRPRITWPAEGCEPWEAAVVWTMPCQDLQVCRNCGSRLVAI